MNLVLPQTAAYAMCGSREEFAVVGKQAEIAWIEMSDRQGDDWHNRHIAILHGFVYIWDEPIPKV